VLIELFSLFSSEAKCDFTPKTAVSRF